MENNNKLLDKSQIFDDLFDNSYVGIIVVNKIRMNILVNDRFCEMFGYEKKELIGKSVSMFHTSKEKYEKFGEIAFNSVMKRKSLSVDYEFEKKDGTTFWAKISGDPLKNKDYILWTLVDIDENVRIKKELEKTSERMNLLIESGTDGIWDWNVKTNEIYYSLGWKRILGYEDHEIENVFDSWQELMNPSYIQSAYEKLNMYLNGEIQRYEIFFEMKHKDGHYVPILSRAKKLLDENGETVRLLGTHTDLTDMQNIQKELEEQRNLLKTIINQIPFPVVLKDYNAKFALVNEATAKLYGDTPENMIGKDDGDYISDKELAEFMRNNVREIMNSGETQVVYEDSIDVEKNEKRNYMSIKKPFENKAGEKFILVLANDITELNRKNEQLAQTERIIFQQSKLASMGEMIANIAHQWRQPLSAISTQATGLKLEKEIGGLSNERLDTVLDNINNTTQFLSQTIDDFRNFYDPKNNQINEVDIKDTIEKSLQIMKGQFKNKEIIVVKDIESCKVNILESELIQVLINILNNSRDALLKMQENRLIKIAVYKVKKSLNIDIQDNAKGIDKEIINKIFEPYFTTKHRSVGTGIGLYMSEEIVVKHLKGQLSVKNSNFEFNDKKYFGAKFTIKIPLK